MGAGKGNAMGHTVEYTMGKTTGTYKSKEIVAIVLVKQTV
jgi:hypothetical protein